jgi:hypothetical protein
MNNEYLWQTEKFQGFVCGEKLTWKEWFMTAPNKMNTQRCPKYDAYGLVNQD